MIRYPLLILGTIGINYESISPILKKTTVRAWKSVATPNPKATKQSHKANRRPRFPLDHSTLEVLWSPQMKEAAET